MLGPSRRVIRRRRRSSSVTLRRFIGLRVASSLRRGLASCDAAPKSTEQRGYAKMPIVRAGRVLLCAAAATTLAGCAGARLSPDAPAGGPLGGAWQLNSTPRAAPPPDVRRGGTRTSQPEDQPLGEDPAPVRTAHGAPRPDPLLRSPMAQVLRTSIARGDFLTVRQGPGEFALDYGTSQRSFTPGAHSVV